MIDDYNITMGWVVVLLLLIVCIMYNSNIIIDVNSALYQIIPSVLIPHYTPVYSRAEFLSGFAHPSCIVRFRGHQHALD